MPNTTTGEQGQFLLPEAAVPYTARYAIVDGSTEMEKDVWRLGRNMRIDVRSPISPGAFSLFFLEGRAYSCTSDAGATSCYDVTGRLSESGVAEFLPEQEPKDGVETDKVDIGGTEGRCYLVLQGIYLEKKLCFTDRGVPAYEQYNQTNGASHVTYLTDISYGADPSAFVLPAQPQIAPPGGE